MKSYLNTHNNTKNYLFYEYNDNPDISDLINIKIMLFNSKTKPNVLLR